MSTNSLNLQPTVDETINSILWKLEKKSGRPNLPMLDSKITRFLAKPEMSLRNVIDSFNVSTYSSINDFQDRFVGNQEHVKLSGNYVYYNLNSYPNHSVIVSPVPDTYFSLWYLSRAVINTIDPTTNRTLIGVIAVYNDSSYSYTYYFAWYINVKISREKPGLVFTYGTDSETKHLQEKLDNSHNPKVDVLPSLFFDRYSLKITNQFIIDRTKLFNLDIISVFEANGIEEGNYTSYKPVIEKYLYSYN